MATADWKRTFKEPEDYGPYLVKVKGEKKHPLLILITLLAIVKLVGMKKLEMTNLS